MVVGVVVVVSSSSNSSSSSSSSAVAVAVAVVVVEVVVVVPCFLNTPHVRMFRRSFQCRSGCRSEGRSPTKWHIPKLPKTSEIAAAVPGILNEGSRNTTSLPL